MPSRPLSDRQSQLSASGHAPSLYGRQQKSEGIVITGNKALNGGGAMYINNKVVDIKGKVNISGNTLADTGATPSNVLLYTAENTCKLNVNGALETTTPIGVGIRQANTTDTDFTPTCGVVTTGYGTDGKRLSREPWTTKYADSENDDGNHTGDKVFDLQESTYWQTERSAVMPHLLVIDLGSEQTISAIEYLPRAE